jgi:adenosylcobinamide kinase / adenosylcobinamide-phosphate guanylyltransferase
MAEDFQLIRSELILGGQKSGKSRRAEMLAARWLGERPDHRAVLIATARAGDDEMRERIARHRQDRAERVPALQTVEEPLELADAIDRHADARTLIVVDCVTLWLTNIMAAMQAEKAEKVPFEASNEAIAQSKRAQRAIDLIAEKHLKPRASRLIFVSNEIGLGVIPMGQLTREFVDVLGLLNQRLAGCCDRVSFMAAGLPLFLKGAA